MVVICRGTKKVLLRQTDDIKLRKLKKQKYKSNIHQEMFKVKLREGQYVTVYKLIMLYIIVGKH
jgi:hypothetical protein